MGEYAKRKSDGEEVKIGTCEEMYYLRADQADKVAPMSGNVDPVRDADGIRFRFPFPDEDTIRPGEFDSYERALFFHSDSLRSPEGVDHWSVQFTADPGYLVSLPCPESKAGPVVHRNGFRGNVGICQQRMVDGKLVLVAKCGGCGTKWRLPTLEDAQPYIDACRDKAEGIRLQGKPDPFWTKVADRIELGYTAPEVLAPALFERKPAKRAPRKKAVKS